MYKSWMFYFMGAGLGFSILGGLISSNWFFIWMMLELNMISFISMIYLNDSFSLNSMLKYFVVQSVSSSFFLFFIILMKLSGGVEFSSVILMVSVSMKLGFSPFHVWFVQCSEGLDWMSFFVLCSLQKILPIYVLSFSSSFIFIYIWFVSLLGGVLGMLNQTSLRKLFAYSSINHLCWMSVSFLGYLGSWSVYLFIYSLMFYLFCSIMKFMNLSSLFQGSGLSSESEGFVYIVNMLSFSGIPPFLGFFNKLYVLSGAGWSGLMVFLLGSSVLNCYIYVRLLFPFLFKGFMFSGLDSPKSSFGVIGVWFHLFLMVLFPFLMFV